MRVCVGILVRIVVGGSDGHFLAASVEELVISRPADDALAGVDVVANIAAVVETLLCAGHTKAVGIHHESRRTRHANWVDHDEVAAIAIQGGEESAVADALGIVDAEDRARQTFSAQ